MANISTAKQTVALCRDADVSLFLWGAHGIGKSSLVRQVTDEQQIRFVDLRCAQLEAVDLRGFPDKGIDGRTHFLPPAELPTEGNGILFLDELNRAGRDVVAALFQLVLDRRIGEYRLPDGWSIVAAGNPDGGDYTVLPLDPAFRDRFCHLFIAQSDETFSEWTDWMLRQHGDAAFKMVNFCSISRGNVEVESSDAIPFEVSPSRRSWDAVVRGMRYCGDGQYPSEVVREFVCGLLGIDVGNSYLNHQPTVRPSDILDLGMRRVRNPLQRCQRDELSAIVTGMAREVPDAMENKQRRENLFDFLEFLVDREADLAVAFCLSVLGTDPEYRELKNTAPLLTNLRLAKKVESLRDESSFLSELIRRDRLTERIGKMMGISR